MRLSQLLSAWRCCARWMDVEITALTFDSVVKPGTAFCCISGLNADGMILPAPPWSRGQRADRAAADGFKRAAGVGEDTRATLPLLAANFTSGGKNACSATGTNGKTTTTYMLKTVLDAAGEKPACWARWR
ncbi:MAG: hypothetical protein ACLUO4_03010 [Christensenellales bacterium]